MSQNQLTPIQKVESQLEDFKEAARKIVAHTNSLKVNNSETLIAAQNLLKSAQQYEKDVETKRTAITKPMNDFLKQVNGLAKTLVAPVLESKTAIKHKILAYQKELEKQAREKADAEIAAKKAELEKQKKEDEERLKILNAEDPEKVEAEKKKLEEERQTKLEEAEKAAKLSTAPKVKGLTKRWTFEVVDESKVPQVFCSPDPKKINEEIKKGARVIHGLRIFEVEDVR